MTPPPRTAHPTALPPRVPALPIPDTLTAAPDYPWSQVGYASKETAEQHFAKALVIRQRESPRVGPLLVLYVDEALNDATPFGSVRRQAFAILPKETLLTVGRRMCDQPVSQIELRWQAVDKLAARFKKHLRPLVTDLDFSSLATPSPWLAALRWMKNVFARQQPLACHRVCGESPPLPTDLGGGASPQHVRWVRRVLF